MLFGRLASEINKLLLVFSYDFNMVKLRAIYDIRNILMSAHQNLSSAQHPLVFGPHKLPLPYCTPDEVSWKMQLLT